MSQGELLGAGARVSGQRRARNRSQIQLHIAGHSFPGKGITETRVRAKPGSCCCKLPMEMLLALPPEQWHLEHKLSEALSAHQNISFEKGEIILQLGLSNQNHHCPNNVEVISRERAGLIPEGWREISLCTKSLRYLPAPAQSLLLTNYTLETPAKGFLLFIIATM